ncbi:MAG: CarD family transcriptional regulator [Myxococcales bacterium]
MPIAESDLKVGDRVVYANQGVCKVVGTTVMEIAGSKQEFVKLAREDDEGTVISVPKGRLDKAGIRRVADASELKKVFAYLAAPVEGPELDWKVRARSHGERMSEGGLMGLAQVVKSLTTLADLRPLPPKERELYDNARHLLVSEVAAASGLLEGSAEDAVDLAMFPPGKERVKPTLAMALGGEDGEELGLDDGLETTTLEDAGLEEEPAEEESGSEGEAGEEAEGEEESAEALKKPRAAKKPAGEEKPAKAPKAPKAEKAPKAPKAAKPKAEPKPKAEKPAKAPKAAKPKAEPKAKPAAKAKPKKK